MVGLTIELRGVQCDVCVRLRAWFDLDLEQRVRWVGFGTADWVELEQGLLWMYFDCGKG